MPLAGWAGRRSLGRAAGLVAAFGRAEVRRLAAVVVRLAALGFAVAFGLLAAGFAVRDRLDVDVVLADVGVVLAVLDLDPAADDRLAVVGLAAVVAGLAADIALAAAVSDLLAVVMALVAAFIACSAVDIVLADDVALVAAAVILVAAALTLVAADETPRAAVAGVVAFLDELRDVLPDAVWDVPREVLVRAVLAVVARA